MLSLLLHAVLFIPLLENTWFHIEPKGYLKGIFGLDAVREKWSRPCLKCLQRQALDSHLYVLVSPGARFSQCLFMIKEV